MKKKFIFKYSALFIGLFIFTAGMIWLSQTEKSNVINRDDDINLIAGYMVFFGFWIICITFIVQIIRYFGHKKQKKL